MFTTFSLAIILDCTVRIVLGTALGAQQAEKRDATSNRIPLCHYRAVV